MDDHQALHRHHVAAFWRSLRDCGWYGGQVAVLTLAWQDKQRPLYIVLAVVAAIIMIVTGMGAVSWWRIAHRDPERPSTS